MPRASTIMSPSWRITTRAAAIRPRRWNIACVRSSSAPTAGPTPKRSRNSRAGLELLQKLPDDDRRAELELDLRNAAGEALSSIKGWASPEAEQSSARAMVLCQRPGINWEKTWEALSGVFLVHLTRPDVRKACEIAAELVARAEEHGSAEHIAVAAYLLAFVKMNAGDFELAAQGFDRGWALLESIAKPATSLTQQRAALMRLRVPLMQVHNRVVSAWNLWFLGYPDRALEQVSIATAIAHESGSKALLEAAHNLAMYIYELRREREHMRERAEATLDAIDRVG